MRDRSERGYWLSAARDSEKIARGVALAKRFDFQKYTRLGDIGGVPFFQARAILDRFPHLTAVLTDYDVASIEAIKEIGIFEGHELAVLDAAAGDFSILDGCDVLTMWGVDYALRDDALVALYRYVARANVTLILATVATSLRMAVSKTLKSALYETAGPARFSRRYIGVLRTESYQRTLIAEGRCRLLDHFCLGVASVKSGVFVIGCVGGG